MCTVSALHMSYVLDWMGTHGHDKVMKWIQFAGHRWIPLTKASDAEHLNKQLSEQTRPRWFKTPSRSSWCHCNAKIYWKNRFRCDFEISPADWFIVASAKQNLITQLLSSFIVSSKCEGSHSSIWFSDFVYEPLSNICNVLLFRFHPVFNFVLYWTVLLWVLPISRTRVAGANNLKLMIHFICNCPFTNQLFILWCNFGKENTIHTVSEIGFALY